MLATMADPSASCFHGALGVSPYAEYKIYTVKSPQVCSAIQAAEVHYSTGYVVAGNNCLNAVYTILRVYGVQYTGNAAGPSFDWCPGAWYDDLTPPDWSAATALTSGTPASAVFCSQTSIPSTCQSVTPQPPSNCGGLDFSNCPLFSLATCIYAPLDLSVCPISCKSANPCLSDAQCNDGKYCWTYWG